MANVYDIIIRPIITERSMEATADKKYVFEVAPTAGKIEIKNAVEQIFGVKVAKVKHQLRWQDQARRRRPPRRPQELEEGLCPADPGFQDHRVLRGYGIREGRSVRNVYQNL